MADRAAARFIIDIGFTCLAIATAIASYVLLGPPDVPAQICEGTGAPRYAELYADQRLTVAVVIGELSGGAADHNAWSERALVRALRERGFTETARGHFELGDTAIDIQLLPNDRPTLSAALTTALVDHDVVYYTGHNNEGELDLQAPAAYRIIMMDTCFSTQFYSAKLVGPNRDVIGNRERAVTGSIESVVTLIDGLHARMAWQALTANLDERAQIRVRSRTGRTALVDAEDYSLDTRCSD